MHHIEDYKGKPSVVVQYNDALYSGELMRTLAKSVLCVVEHIIENPNGKIRKVSLLDNAAIAQLESFKSTEIAPVKTKLLHKMFEEQVAKAPDRIALSACDGKLTYKELDRLANITANSLIEKGLEKGGKVLILLERTSKFFTSLLGILKAGGAFIPSCPDYPKERIDSIIEDSDADFVITEGELLNKYDRTVDVSKLLSGNNEENPNVDVQPDDLAYLIYTSGSTGKPKGVMLRHIGIANYLAYSDSNIQVKEIVDNCHAYGSVTTISFDMSLKETMLSLCNGLTLVFASNEQTVNPMLLAEFFKENNVDAFNSTPSRLLQYMELDEFAEAMANCKVILSGGEKYPDKLLRVLREKTNATIINTYGPTEITVSSNAKNLTNADEISIGRPLRNYTEYIVDSDNNLLPIGVVGELLIQGCGVALGYNKLPEQTAKAYEKNPYCNEKGYERLYHTGDIVRLTDEGKVDFIGRNDGQVKIRGFRIELSEVDKIIRKYDGITNTAVIARKLEGGGQCINAYIVADRKIDIQKLNEFILEHKPPYMVPAATMQIDKIPLNVNGKVDKRKLPEIKAETSKKKNSAPRKLTFLEKKISAIIERIIGHSDFDISENLINAGMTSLSVIKLAVELNKAFGFEAQVKKMMKGCSVLSIEDELQEYMFSGTANQQAVKKEEKKEHKALYPLSKTQLGVYIDCMKNPYSTLYNIPSILTFSKSVDAQKLADCVVKVIKAHPYIMTHLSLENDDIEQAYVDSAKPNVPVENLTEEQLENYKKDFVKPHNLMKAPLFRISVAETEKAVYLLSDFHHLIFDGASVALFFEQLKTLYEGGNIEPESYTYFDYAENEIKAESSDEFRNAEKFFDNMMKNFESASEITADLRAHAEDGTLASQAVPVDMARVENFCSQHGITPAHLFLAGTFYAVSRFVNSRNVYISTISNGRSDMRLTNCFGMFVKTLALGIEIEDITSLEFVEKSKAVFTDSIENEIYPYAQLCAKYGYAPNIMYEYQLGVVDNLEIDGKTVVRDYLEMNTAKFKTAVHIEDYKGKPSVVVQYNDALYSGELMRTLAKSVLCVVEHIIENPNGKIRKVSLLDNAAIAQLESFKSTEIAPVKTKLLHKMFEEQVAKAPDRIALSACDGKLTYKELDRLANITANSLIEKGLEKGGKVLILLERTSKFFTSLLGILKAGGAFIPSCPDYPKERIDSIIEDSDADFVITEGELLNKYDRTVDVSKLLSGNNEENPNVDVQPDDLAYLIYTSGSTGKPKGVMLRHIGIANYLAYSDSNIQVKEIVDNCHAYGSVTTISFDMSLKETMLSLCNGLTLVFASNEQTVNPMLLAEFFKENNVDAFNSTPSRLLQYMELDEFAEAMANCKVILSGGEKYPDKLLRVLREKTNATIINTYGPTEITVSSNAKNLTNADEISIGRPLRNYTEYIVDSDNNLLPIGVVGELLIQGCGVALGYNKLPEQTAKAYEKNPYCNEKGYERLYHTGDIVRLTDEGKVDFIGRNDGQVKIRGFRIELSEVDKIIRKYDGITNTAVIARKLEGGGQCINAYIVADRKIDIQKLNEFILEHKPPYMVPAATMQIDKIPLNVNGKVDKRKLPEIKAETSKKKNSAPRKLTFLEKKISAIIERIIGHSDFDISENLINAGMTSLSVIKLAVELNKAFGFEAQVKKMMKGCSVLSIEDELQEYMFSGTANQQAVKKEEKKEHKALYPLSKTQLGVYIDCMKNPYSTLYNIPSILTFSKSVDAQKLADCVVKVIKAHPYIMTHLSLENDDIEQAYVDSAKPNVPVENLTEEQLENYKKDFVRRNYTDSKSIRT